MITLTRTIRLLAVAVPASVLAAVALDQFWVKRSGAVLPPAAVAAPAVEPGSPNTPPTDPRAFSGRDFWLFHSRRRDAYARPTELPLKNAEVIADFDRQCKAAGVALIFVPMPDQVYLYRDMLREHEPQLSRGHYLEALDRLREQGVCVVNPTESLEKLRESGTKVAQTQDAHLTPEAYRHVAGMIADAVRKKVSLPEEPALFEAWDDHMNEITALARDVGFPAKPVDMRVRRVRYLGNGALFSDRPASPLVLFGDSNVVTFRDEHCSLADALAYELKIAPDVLARENGGIANSTRMELARRRDAMRGKTCVVWVCMETFLSDEGWTKVPIVPMPGGRGAAGGKPAPTTAVGETGQK